MESIRVLFCLVLLGAGTTVVARAEGKGLPDLVVPLDQSSEKRDAALEFVKTGLSDHPGKAGAEPEFAVTKAGLGLLWGDLFKTGGCFALAELTAQNDQEWDAAGVVLTEWVDYDAARPIAPSAN